MAKRKQPQAAADTPEDIIESLGDPALDPYEIEFSPEHRESRGPRGAFVNEHGAVIGDHDYESPQSPLENWSKDTDPTVMAGDEWVHPYKDVGFHTEENRDYFEKGIPPKGGIYMHPTIDVAYPYNLEDETADASDAPPPRKK
ncbi:MAG TPA: DUF3905 domain-containing protein [Paenibacillus sp.]|nr:DUF3905 domain-containing protein [Paenibacillus sp.]